jgi:hypothetical protein
MKNKFKYIVSAVALLIFILFINEIQAQAPKSSIKIARIKYSGGGDWYNDPSGEVNLLSYIEKNTNISVNPVYEWVDLATDNLFQYPLIFLTGHGNMKFSDNEISRLRAYLENGGFLLIDDDYGLNDYVHKEMKRVFPEQNMIELPFTHGIYSSYYKFPHGLPKTHEHDGKTPQGFGLFFQGRLCVFYVYESDIADGWVDSEVHKDTPQVREDALKMGVNIIVWALSN